MVFADAARHHLEGRLPQAEAGYQRALELGGKIPEAHNNLGVLVRSRDAAKALQHFRRAVSLRPDYLQGLVNLGLALQRAGNPTEAREMFRRATLAHPRDAGAHNNLGLVELELGNPELAERALERAIALAPADPAPIANLGNVRVAQNRFDDATGLYRRALEIAPEYVEALNNLGEIYRAQGRTSDAMQCYHRALVVRPDNLDVLHNLALAVALVPESAARNEAILRDAVDRNGGAPEYRAVLAAALQEMGRLGEAREEALRALAQDPAQIRALTTLAIVAVEANEHDEALGYCDQALAHAPRDTTARWNRALALLSLGDHELGWDAYEVRRELVSMVRDRRVTTSPEWDGSPLAGRAIVLYAEQGLGDTLHFVRYARLLKEWGAGAVLVECGAEISEFVSRVPGVDRAIQRGEPLPPHDVHAYLLSLPRLTRLRADRIPARVPYLASEPRPIGELIQDEPGVLRVGIVWAGGALHRRDHIRSAGLDAFRPLLAVPGVRFYSLQKGPREADLKPGDGVIDLGPHIIDLFDTAAAIEKLDLVIAVDTAVAHLAGGLGRPTWLLLPWSADWRWMKDRTDSPWYPTMRLYRQPAEGAWNAVFGAVAADLHTLTARAGAIEAPPATAPLRFTVQHEDAPCGVPIPVEHSVGSDELELAMFLREVLRAGDLLVDYAPGAASAAIIAASAADTPAVPLLLVEPSRERAAAWRARVERACLGELVHVVEVTAADLPSIDALAGSRTFLRVGEAGAADALLGSAAELLERGDLAAALWPSPPSLDPSWFADRLPSGYEHFVLQVRDGELNLDPLGVATQGPVASVSHSLLRELGMPSPAATPTADASTWISRGAEGAAAGLAIDWPIGVGTGWGTYGANLALELAARGDVPLLLGGGELGRLSPLALHLLGPAIDRSREHAASLAAGRSISVEFPLLHGLGNGMVGRTRPAAVTARADVGVIFFEDTLFPPAALERARRFDRIVAGSTWNAEVLRGYGLDHVVVALQGVDPTLFHAAPRSDRFRDRFVVYSGGKLEYRKGQDIVIAAFREFQRRHPEALLVFAWHNHWPANMEEIPFGGHVEGLPRVGDDGRIDFGAWLEANGVPRGAYVNLGMVPNSQMGHLIREADVALFPNRCEGGTNLVAMEALACGVPTVLSANTGHLDLIGDEHCYALRRQGPVAASRHCVGQEGWGESEVEEVLATLERIHADREDAAARGLAGARFMETLSWRRQVGQLLDSVADLL